MNISQRVIIMDHPVILIYSPGQHPVSKLLQDIIKKELSKIMNQVRGHHLGMSQNSLMVTTSNMLIQEGEGMLAWLTDLQMLAVMTGNGWRQIVVRRDHILEMSCLVLANIATNHQFENVWNVITNNMTNNVVGFDTVMCPFLAILADFCSNKKEPGYVIFIASSLNQAKYSLKI